MYNAIDQQVGELCGRQLVHYRKHLDDNYYVSVTTGYACVDIRRRFFKPRGSREYEPMKHGLALRLDE